jgi:hypothetical protein
VDQVKRELFSHPDLEGIAGPLNAPDGYSIRYVSGDKLVELYDEDQIMYGALLFFFSYFFCFFFARVPAEWAPKAPDFSG